MGIDKVMLLIDSMGVLCVSKGEMVLYPSMNQNFSNDNGAGDAFMAGAMVGYLNSKDNFSMVNYGFAAASIALLSRYNVSPNMNFDNLMKQVKAYAV